MRRIYEILIIPFVIFFLVTLYRFAFLNEIDDITRPYFKRFHNIDCARIFANDTNYITKMTNHRIIVENDEKLLQNDCKSIRSRNYFAAKSMSNTENEFPLAFANIAYRDYLFLERALSSIYAPQNHYCYILDAKATKVFRKNMRKLAECLSNVHLIENDLLIDSQGGNMTRSYLLCLQLLLRLNDSWKYAIILQNHDFPLRTNREIVEILTELNGTNDVELTESVPHQRIPANMSFDIYDLELFNPPRFRQGEANLELSKGYVQSSLSRAFVEFIVDKLNLTILLKRFDERIRTSELFWATINFDKNLKAPGGLPKQCHNYLQKAQNLTNYITRHSIWLYPNQTHTDECKSGRNRHWICTFGVEDLPNLNQSPLLFANKFRPSFDYGSTICMHELIFNRTFANSSITDKEFYRKTPGRIYETLKSQQESSFNCTIHNA